MKRTVFVTGAGASLEFDRSNTMPTGAVLAEQIEALLNSEILNQSLPHATPIANEISRDGGFGSHHLAAMRRIKIGIHSANSIDQFIDETNDPDVTRIAKLCIAHLILAAERASLLFEEEAAGNNAMRQLRDTWLGQILRNANPDQSRQEISPRLDDVAFVTFNYDRCIERFIDRWVATATGLSEDKAVLLSAKIPVHHVYGSLGSGPIKLLAVAMEG